MTNQFPFPGGQQGHFAAGNPNFPGSMMPPFGRSPRQFPGQFPSQFPGSIPQQVPSQFPGGQQQGPSFPPSSPPTWSAEQGSAPTSPPPSSLLEEHQQQGVGVFAVDLQELLEDAYSAISLSG